MAESARQHLAIFGAGGHGRECAWLAMECGHDAATIVHLVDNGPQQLPACSGWPVMTVADFLERYGASPMVVAVGGCKERASVVGRMKAHGFTFPGLRSPRSLVAPGVSLGEGVIVFPGAVISVGAVIGDHVHINTGASVSHDCKLDAFATLSPHAVLCGYVHVGHATLIGANACVLEGKPGRPRRIGAFARVGGGACIVTDVPEGATFVGVPGRAR